MPEGNVFVSTCWLTNLDGGGGGERIVMLENYDLGRVGAEETCESPCIIKVSTNSE